MAEQARAIGGHGSGDSRDPGRAVAARPVIDEAIRRARAAQPQVNAL
jgi:hypothetical protein